MSDLEMRNLLQQMETLASKNKELAENVLQIKSDHLNALIVHLALQKKHFDLQKDYHDLLNERIEHHHGEIKITEEQMEHFINVCNNTPPLSPKITKAAKALDEEGFIIKDKS